MIVKISHTTANLLSRFLLDADHLRMPKKYSAALSRLRSDVHSRQVNSDRFNYALPIVRMAHSSMQTLVAQVFKWKRIARWKRWLLLPALVEYFFRVLPGYYEARGKLIKVAKEVKELEKACSLGGKS